MQLGEGGRALCLSEKEGDVTGFARSSRCLTGRVIVGNEGDL